MTVVRSVLSKKNPYYISSHRYHELKNFCRQYGEWKNEVSHSSVNVLGDGFSKEHVDHTGDDAIAITKLKQRMKLIEQTCLLTEPELAPYIFRGVTEGLSYNTLYSLYEIPCSKDQYYIYYRKFFWLLDKQR